ncbi:MAG: hypothetical protein J6Q94_01090 [Clostridia bacterium]|nr:hypothetical protein [Clostridia bacterium]
MKICRDCIHYDVCDCYHTATDTGRFAYQNFSYEDRNDVEESCDDFKDKSLVLDLPCKVGDTVYFHHIIGINKDSSPIKKVRAGIIHKIQVEMDNQIWIGVSFGIWYCCRPYTDFYFNREAAEQALQKRGVQE